MDIGLVTFEVLFRHFSDVYDLLNFDLYLRDRLVIPLSLRCQEVLDVPYNFSGLLSRAVSRAHGKGRPLRPNIYRLMATAAVVGLLHP